MVTTILPETGLPNKMPDAGPVDRDLVSMTSDSTVEPAKLELEYTGYRIREANS